MTGHLIVKTTSHRQREKLRQIEGIVGPYWVGPSIFDKVKGEFWIVPAEQRDKALRITGTVESKRTTPADLGKFWSSAAPDPIQAAATLDAATQPKGA